MALRVSNLLGVFLSGARSTRRTDQATLVMLGWLAMDDSVKIEPIRPRLLAAVRRTAAPREIPGVFKPALDLVWAFLGRHKGLRTDGHNVFLYHHVQRTEAGMPVDFGVEVTRHFQPEGEVRCVETPAGEAAVVEHHGAYSGIPKAHAALHAWCAANGRTIGAYSLEVYGDWSDDPSKVVTTIQYLLR
jgi:effector-binding domain-containing protein